MAGRTLTQNQRKFLEAFRLCGNITSAAEAASVDRKCHNNWLNETACPGRGYPEAFAAAQDEAADHLEAEARRRAMQGVERLKFHQGQLIQVQARGADGQPLYDADGQPVMVPYVEHEYSDTLLIFLLKGARPEVYRERSQINMQADVQHSGGVQIYLPENERDANAETDQPPTDQ